VTEDPGRQHIVAVVVTFNRLDLLRDLVATLEQVPGLDEVLVIDNASTDGTRQWLAGLGSDRVRGRSLTTNTGGAGGFHEGLRWAIERGSGLAHGRRRHP
jgi:rhamnopyranosyl-N-acetylglucosaminyl-diphospho-decaprenol beta-1,3/1,4-galactofuranosyltransferase